MATLTHVRSGDVITSLNGEAVSSASDLRRRIQRLDDGGEFTLGIVRDRKSMTLKGRLEARESRQCIYRS